MLPSCITGLRLDILEIPPPHLGFADVYGYGGALVDLISGIKGCGLEEARTIVARIQSFWHDDIHFQRKRKHQTVRNSEELVSVSEATRLLEGPINVTGKIVGMNLVQPMISMLYIQCSECSASPSPIDYTSKPVWRSPIKEHSRSYFCECKGNTVIITDYEYIASLEIQIQDLEKVNNIEQLTAVLFEQDTEGIQFNDIVILKGNLHVVRKYDNPSNNDDSSGIITDNKSIEAIVLKHSPAAHVLTNDDLEDIDNSSNESGGESV
jgi:hypothetical protein